VRILVFNPSYPPVACGVGDYTRGLATALVSAGHDVTVVTAAGATDSAEGPPRVLPLLRNWDVGEFVRAWPRFALPRPDLVVSCFPAVVRTSRSRLLYLLPGVAKAMLGWPRTALVVHEFIRTGDAERRRLGLALRAADRIVAVTEAEARAIAARYPSVADRTVVRHNAPNVPVVADDPAQDARLHAGLSAPGRPLIAFFGFIWSAAKGFEELLEALATTNATLVVTGSLDPGNAYHRHVAAVIGRLGLEDRVRWLDFLGADAVGRLLRAADAVVLPFRGGAESGYTSLLAAIVNGAALVTTRGPENPPWLEDGVTALLVDPGDPAALRGAIERLVTDARLAARVRAGARQLSFGWDGIVDAVVDPRPGPSPGPSPGPRPSPDGSSGDRHARGTIR
jgi:glycosyltransferase involved in cell wall biosynthesis